jgi:antitoxin (DNA-binding transcriptional repressor) of toxin-antitoxin stability system
MDNAVAGALGEEIIISRAGTPVAKVVPSTLASTGPVEAPWPANSS